MKTPTKSEIRNPEFRPLPHSLIRECVSSFVIRHSSFRLRLLSALATFACALVAVASAAQPGPQPSHTFAIGTNDFLLDGQRLQIRCGEIHAARVPMEYWRHRLQMAKAMGLNTVCAYLFWNLHEPKPGEFVWTGQADDAEFCRIAQEEGLWVILRPGPYACAEWEMGGTPWWLLKDDDVKFRTRDPRYINAVKSYLKEVGRVLGPLQITHGGPIIMAQVENEYGFFGKDAGYMEEFRKAMMDAGFDVPLFECNPPDHDEKWACSRICFRRRTLAATCGKILRRRASFSRPAR